MHTKASYTAAALRRRASVSSNNTSLVRAIVSGAGQKKQCTGDKHEANKTESKDNHSANLVTAGERKQLPVFEYL